MFPICILSCLSPGGKKATWGLGAGGGKAQHEKNIQKCCLSLQMQMVLPFSLGFLNAVLFSFGLHREGELGQED